MSNKMIERVAKILVNQGDSSDYNALARRVIAAMREPTEEMLKSFSVGGFRIESQYKETYVEYRFYQAMIDAALKED